MTSKVNILSMDADLVTWKVILSLEKSENENKRGAIVLPRQVHLWGNLKQLFSITEVFSIPKLFSICEETWGTYLVLPLMM